MAGRTCPREALPGIWGLPLNGATHVAYGKTVARLIVAHGFAPAAARFLTTPEERAPFIEACALPDLVHEVACNLPGAGPQTDLLGHGLSSFQHFQIFQRGYRWHDDPSLSLGDTAEAVAGLLAALAPLPGLGLVADLASAASALARIAGLRISVSDSEPQPPVTGLLRDAPMRAALAQQPGFSIGTFCFPSAASGASFYGLASRRWADQGVATGWRRCAGYALHLVQDSCVPHHAWGVLLFGHADWEDALQAAWHETLTEVLEANLFEATIAKTVACDLTDVAGCLSLAELCEANAAWAVTRFGTAHHLEECPGDVALRVSIRAIAASVHACQLMSMGA